MPDPSYAFERVYRTDGYTLAVPAPFRRGVAEQHIGEAITDPTGCAACLRTFRLPEARIGRGRLLQVLHDHDRHLGGAAKTLGTAGEALVGRIPDRGRSGSLPNAHEAARRARATRRA
ncbi:hypothetical protein QFZ82_005700 [Streptomyces sp. V4I23]|uniref:hypothetical protein n=1 Tax=Streptomyces sp. V4I23 TaxID=3042282 RepID=UPI00278BA720|nr:hypothetical protein [Streptomyces sp. V4I23]MDQ1011215.1 hypothetical protein [Streptomyces sp. V4I23]